MTTVLDHGLVTDLTDRVSGSVVRPDDHDYNAVRSVHNGLIDRKPALIVRARAAADVVAALAFARGAGLEVSVRGGGHNVAGRAVTDGGVMIDLAELKGIEVDPISATATAGGGGASGGVNDADAEDGVGGAWGGVSPSRVAGFHP